MRRSLAFIICLVCLASLTGCGGSGSSGSSPGTTASAPQRVVDVSGLTMTLNGSPWLSKGVVLQGFVRPIAALQADSGQSGIPEILNARENYGQAELAAIHAFQADTIRFQIGQPALDPASPLYDPTYLSDVVSAIKTARQAGFVVMIMMQDEQISERT